MWQLGWGTAIDVLNSSNLGAGGWSATYSVPALVDSPQNMVQVRKLMY